MNNSIITTGLQPDDLIRLDLHRPATGDDPDGKCVFFGSCESNRKGGDSGHYV